MTKKTFFRCIPLLAVGCAFVGALYYFAVMGGSFFSNEGFMPHGHCYLWTPSLVWTMLTTDALIGIAYASISICLYVLVRRIKLPFSTMFLAFGAFIAACGTTHIMEVYTLWFPNYWLAALIKVITAIASVITAILIFPLFPRVVAFAESAALSEERKRKLEEVNRILDKKNEELQAANKELEAFSYSVSHDLRSPLRGIDGFSKALLDDYSVKLDDQGRQYLKFIREGSQRMGQIIDDLLNLSRMTQMALKILTVNLSQLATDIVDGLKTQDRNRNVTIQIQPNLVSEGDTGLIRIVLENLISNAWKFSAKTANAKIEFGAQAKKEQIVYFVRDNGVGFDMAYASKLFTAFQRLHSDDEYAGTGVGLATAKRIIHRHGGEIWVQSEAGKGTTFYFTLGGLKNG